MYNSNKKKVQYKINMAFSFGSAETRNITKVFVFCEHCFTRISKEMRVFGQLKVHVPIKMSQALCNNL